MLKNYQNSMAFQPQIESMFVADAYGWCRDLAIDFWNSQHIPVPGSEERRESLFATKIKNKHRETY